MIHFLLQILILIVVWWIWISVLATSTEDIRWTKCFQHIHSEGSETRNKSGKWVSIYLAKDNLIVAPWCSGYHYCTTSFNKTWTQNLSRFKSCSQRVGDSWWWGSVTMVLDRNYAKCLSSVNLTTKTIHHHLHQDFIPQGLELIFFVW